jgi:flagellar biogenesis protein FliO
MKNIVLYLIILLTLVSCDPVKRHQRLVNKYPYVHTNVTQTVPDTTVVYVPEVKHDTTVVTKQQDTIIIEKERLRINIIRELDTLHIEGECAADTIIVTKTITLSLYTSTTSKDNKLIGGLLLVLLLVILLLWWLKKQ